MSSPRRPWVAFLLAAAVLAVVLAAVVPIAPRSARTEHAETSAGDATHSASSLARGSEVGAAQEAGAGSGAAPSVEADGGVEQDRIQREGTAPRTGRIEHAPLPGWTGEQLYSANGNDWEPAVAADPSAPYLVTLTTRYTKSGTACPTCPLPYIIDRVSTDGGQTFGPDQYLCACLSQTHGQYDPQITVDGSGNFYAAWIQGNRIVFSKSTDHGVTWTPFVDVSSPVAWGDHPWITVGADGQDVYIAFNHAESEIAASHDGGTTWVPPVQTSHNGFFHYAGGGYVAANGNVTIVQESYGREGGQRAIHVDSTWSHDDGATWNTTIVDTMAINPPCHVGGCFNAFLGGHAAVAGDATGKVVIAYDGSLTPLGNEYIWIRRSRNGGQSWSRRTRVSPAKNTRVAGFPAMAATGNGDFRLWYQDNRNGGDRWNTWYRRSTNGGRTWTTDARLSNATSGTPYKHAKGYDFPYGDYGELAITNAGKSFAIWGEGFSYAGPGGTWFNLQT